MRPIALIALLVACNGSKSNPGGAADDTGGGGTGGDDTGGDGTGDDGGTTDPSPGDMDWTEGPDLPSCTAHAGTGDLVALSGVVLGPDGAEAGLVVYDRGTGLLSCVGADCDASAAELICTEGVISAGLIDTHDHLQYNVLPPWQHEDLFEDRYDWRSSGDYWDYRTAYDEIYDDYTCEIMRWAELRVLVGGGTSGVGSSGGSCIEGLIRNLDEGTDEHGLSGYDLYYSSSTVTSSFDAEDGARYADDIDSGYYEAVLNHVAEAVGGAGRSEIDWMIEIGMTGPGFAFVHATDASTSQLSQLAADQTTIIWSPRSNLDLYAATTPADVAARLGVPVVLGPDWTWSGSLNPAHEAACAIEYLDARGNPFTDVQLHGMITGEAARAVGLDGRIGSLQVGLEADLAVFSWSTQPYRAVLQSGSEDVRLTVVGGEALYGVEALVTAAREDGGAACEAIDACEASRSVCATSGSSGSESLTAAELEATLSAALGAVTMPSGLDYAHELGPLWDCEGAYATCDPRSPSTGDEDGDGVTDTEDLCVGWWDPTQDDLDGDGQGDACDPCPLVADETDCPTDATDVDGDGVPNDEDDCPYVNDPGQEDGDGDGVGDACDACPEISNPGGGPCPSTVDAVRDPTHPDHPPEGQAVTLSGLIVTSIRTNGYSAQDPVLTEYGGIFIYTGDTPSLSEGDEVEVSGSYTEYYGLSELTDAETTVVASGSPLSPIKVASTCRIGTAGDLAEPLESMLVEVEDLVVSSSNPDGSSDYGEFEVDGCLRVDDGDYDFGDQPAEGTEYDSITGVLSYGFSNSKLQPRAAEDLLLAN